MPSALDYFTSLEGMQRGLQVLGDTVFDRRLRLAVTGLRHAGKTVFLTSLVYHLLHPRHLPFLEVVHEHRLIGVRLLQPPPGMAGFPYRVFADALGAPTPHWPQATEQLSGLTLALRFRPKHPLVRQFKSDDTLKLELIDYPGEWLLDLPLLERDFEGWSAEQIALAEREPRLALAADWRTALADLDPAGPADDETAARLGRLYAAFLLRCQSEAGLSLLQPGRFTLPGDLAGSELLAFCPLPAGPAPRGSLRALMAERFRRYKDRVVAPFYEHHFATIDRQVVLVDLLEPLNRGPAVFADTKLALEAILQSFAYGRSSWLKRLFDPRIDRLLFAATKADHVAANQHPNLKQLTQRLVEEAARGAAFEGVRIETLAVASIRSTDTVRTEHHGQELSCVRGVLRDEERETVLFPGEIPPEPPDPEDWTPGRFRFRAFAPRRLGAEDVSHLRLDQALEFLIGDRLR